MGRLTQWVVIEADVAVRRMSHDQKVRLADEIYAQQPNMLASILALPRMGVDMSQLEVALHGKRGPQALLTYPCRVRCRPRAAATRSPPARSCRHPDRCWPCAG